MSEIRTEKDFLEWLMEMRFYNGFSRYGQFNGNQVFVAVYGWDDDIRGFVCTLDDSDEPAIEAAMKLEELQKTGKIMIESDDDPALAMAQLTHRIREHYFYANKHLQITANV